MEGMIETAGSATQYSLHGMVKRAPYPDYANPELLEKIPLTARTILDVGCAQGALGAAYLRRNPLARVLGIDSDPAALLIARGRLTETICADVAITPMPFINPNGIDCIIYGDVLEHLADPWTLLAQHAEHLAPGGTVLVCMPNVEHWQLTRLLLTGGFDYQDTGLLDRTHLRWFTPRNMGDALVQAGLELADLAPRPIETAGAERFVQAMAPGLREIGVDPQAYLDRAWPLQFIWRARKPTARTGPCRIFVNATALPPQGGVSEVRVVQPMRALRSDSAVLGRIADEAELPHLDAQTPHIAVLHRPLLLGEAGITRIKNLLAKNYVVVAEFDDHPNFMAGRGVAMDQLLSFKGVHAIQTSTRTLAAVLRPENPEIGVFPNAIFELPDIRNFTDPERLTLFFGALNRQDDWQPLLPALNAVAQTAGAKLQFSVVHDRGFFDALETPHKKFTPTCDYATYMQLLGEAEIAFMPLADTAFNRAKSDLKFIEAAACRVAVLASPVVYAEVVETGITGLLCRDEASLRSHLRDLLTDPEAARRMADAARHYVASQRMLAYQVAKRTAWYRALWEDRSALNQALRLRMPQLFE
jgi:2-polyprenyl-3-methyl-5-hydroxy-6-metoxy-1,4-benzoquinol methylase